uniref:Uncharacterized protein n=1 Tax=Oryza punctata TaxID=4537 RepID=A0A0E0LYF1_ORYPU
MTRSPSLPRDSCRLLQDSNEPPRPPDRRKSLTPALSAPSITSCRHPAPPPPPLPPLLRIASPCPWRRRRITAILHFHCAAVVVVQHSDSPSFLHERASVIDDSGSTALRPHTYVHVPPGSSLPSANPANEEFKDLAKSVADGLGGRPGGEAPIALLKVQAWAARTLGVEKKPARVFNTDDSPLCHVDVAKAKEPWSMKPCVEGIVEWSCTHERASWTKVGEDALKTKTVTRSWQSLGKMTPKSQCSQIMEDETSRRTRGQLGMNARNDFANNAQAR